MTRESVPEALPFRSANAAWADRVAKGGDKLAYKYKADGAWRNVSWKESDVQAREVAAGLAALGIRTGDRVCILAQTRFEWMMADIGILLAGATGVPIYPSSTPDQSAFILRDCGARAAFVDDAAQLEKLLPQLLTGADLYLIYIDADAELDRPDARGRTTVVMAEVLAAVPKEAARRIVSYADLRKNGVAWAAQAPNGAEMDRRRSAPGPADTFTIIYTSGTTGNPKGVVLSHENIVSTCASACRALSLSEDDLQFLWLTLAHVFARVIAWAAIFMGLPVAFGEGLTKIKDNLLEVRPTFMGGVPRIYEKFYSGVKAGMSQGSALKRGLVAWAFGVGARHARLQREGKTPGGWLAFQHRMADKLVLGKLRAKLGLERTRFLISGGAPLSAEIAEFFHGAGLLILEGYGLTETTAASFVNRVERYRFGTVGPAIDIIKTRIAEDGEILLHGPPVFKRYHNNAAATAEALDPDGWFHTGDIGHLEDGFLRITDRKKDLIVLAGGKKVPPQVLENALKTRSGLISQVLVFGDRRPYCVALVTLGEDAVKRYGNGDNAKAAANPEVNAELKKAVDGLNATLASFETIKRFAVLSEDFTVDNNQLTPSLKVKRKVAVDRHKAVIEDLYRGGGGGSD